MNDKYNNILNLPHHVSKKHPQISIEARAAQFASFAALTGYNEAVKETARLTNERIELDEEVKQILNKKIQTIKENIKNMPKISFRYFIPDSRKQGGKYENVIGRVKKINEYNCNIILKDNTTIPIKEIIDISGDIVKDIEL